MDFSATFVFIALVLSAIVSAQGAETLDASNITAHWLFPRQKNIPAACDNKNREAGFHDKRMINILRGASCADMFSTWKSTESYDASNYAVIYSKRMPVLLPSASKCFNAIMSFWDKTCLHESYYRPSIKLAGFQSFIRYVSFYGLTELENALNADYMNCYNVPAYDDPICKIIYDNRDSSRNFLDSIFHDSYKFKSDAHKLCLAYQSSSACLTSKAEVCGNPTYKSYINTHFSNIQHHLNCNSHAAAGTQISGSSASLHSFHFIGLCLGLTLLQLQWTKVFSNL